MKIEKFPIIIAAFCLILIAGNASAGSISIAPGDSPAGQYVPLSLFGIPAISGVGDDTITNFTVPFFSYAGESWNRIGVGSNGALVVGGDSPAPPFTNTALPNPNQPNNLLAPFWTDLDPTAGGAIRIGALTDGSDLWIVTDWAEVPNFSDHSVLNSFEVWIGVQGNANPGDDITFVYGTVGNGDLGNLTVGAEDKTGLVGATYYFNGTGTLPVEGTELRVVTEGLPAPVPEPASLLLLGTGLGVIGLAAYRRRKM